MTTDQTPMAHIPWTDSAEIARSAFGVALAGPGMSALPLVGLYDWIKDIRGIGLSVPNDGRIRNAVSQHCYVGARLSSSDSRIIDTDSFNHRDACLWIAKDAGNCQSTGCHFYGARVPVYNEGGWQYRSTIDTIADSYIGTLCDAQSKFTGTMFQHNMVRDAVLRGGSCELNGCTINMQLEASGFDIFSVPGLPAFKGKAGVEFIGNGGRMRGCQVVSTNTCDQGGKPTGKAARGVIINASDIRITDTDFVDADDLEGSIGIQIAGPRKDIFIDAKFEGFQKPADRILVVEDAAHTNGLDVTLRINGMVKPPSGYIDIGPGWSGSIRLIDTAIGKTRALLEGKATR